jgi:hypothetical protein
VENLVDLHAAEMVQTKIPRFARNDKGIRVHTAETNRYSKLTVIPSKARNLGFAYTVTAA